MHVRSLALAALSVLILGSVSQADWTRYRGPNGDGICQDGQSMPVRWNETANLKWKIKLPGAGVSSPIIVGDRVYVTCYSGYGLDREDPGDQKNLKRHLVCVDRKSGKEVWRATVDPVLPEDPYSGIGVTAHGYASHSPVSDGEHIFVFFGKSGALCFDKNGKKVWQTSVGTESDRRRWGSASSPILYKNLLIVPAICESEALVALDKKTGKPVWKQEARGLSSSWSTPILVKVNDKRTDLVIGVPKEIWGINPDNGKLRWYCEAVNSDSFCSCVVEEDGVIYALGARGGDSVAIRGGGEGDVSKTHVIWTSRESNRFCSPVIQKGRVYSVGGGIASVLDAKSGERIKRFRLRGSSGGGGRRAEDYASPILADGKIYCVRSSGDVYVLKPNDELEQLAHNRMTTASENFSATPAASKGDLFVRSNKHLYCVSAMGQKVPDEPKVAAADEDEEEAEAGRGGRRGGRGDRGRGGRRRFDPEAMFKDRDSNGDGKLSGDEISSRMRDRMDDFDGDKDGAVTLEEFKKGMERFRGRGGRGRRGGRGGRGGRDGGQETRPERPQRPEMDGAKPAKKTEL